MHVPYLLYNGVSLPLNLQMKFPCNYSTNVLENVSLTAVHAAFNLGGLCTFHFGCYHLHNRTNRLCNARSCIRNDAPRHN